MLLSFLKVLSLVSSEVAVLLSSKDKLYMLHIGVALDGSGMFLMNLLAFAFPLITMSTRITVFAVES